MIQLTGLSPEKRCISPSANKHLSVYHSAGHRHSVGLIDSNLDEVYVTTDNHAQARLFDSPPILAHKHYDAPSVFTPESLLREARRQKGLPPGQVPAICVLDPDGDLVDYLQRTGQARCHAAWACYHTQLHTFVHDEIEYGTVGRVVGAPFAVLVAEELFASGCQKIAAFRCTPAPPGQPTPLFERRKR